MARSLLIASPVTETLDSTTTRKSSALEPQPTTRSPATSKISGNTSLALASEQGRQRSQSRRGICPIASKVNPASPRRQYCKAKRRRHIHCRLRCLCQTRSFRKQNARLFRNLLQLPTPHELRRENRR